jgi:hypothetical protein
MRACESARLQKKEKKRKKKKKKIFLTMRFPLCSLFPLRIRQLPHFDHVVCATRRQLTTEKINNKRKRKKKKNCLVPIMIELEVADCVRVRSVKLREFVPFLHV